MNNDENKPGRIYKCDICSKEETDSIADEISHLLDHGTNAIIAARILIKEQKDMKFSNADGDNAQTGKAEQAKVQTAPGASATTPSVQPLGVPQTPKASTPVPSAGTPPAPKIPAPAPAQPAQVPAPKPSTPVGSAPAQVPNAPVSTASIPTAKWPEAFTQAKHVINTTMAAPVSALAIKAPQAPTPAAVPTPVAPEAVTEKPKTPEPAAQ
jgi:hypothetical protein